MFDTRNLLFTRLMTSVESRKENTVKDLNEYNVEYHKSVQDPSYVPSSNADYDIQALVEDAIDDLINAGNDPMELDVMDVIEKVLRFTKGQIMGGVVRPIAERALLATQFFYCLPDEEQKACNKLMEYGLVLMPSVLLKLAENRQQLLDKIQQLESDKERLRNTIRMYRSRYLKLRTVLGNMEKDQ